MHHSLALPGRTMALRELATADGTGVIHNVSIGTSRLAVT